MIIINSNNKINLYRTLCKKLQSALQSRYIKIQGIYIAYNSMSNKYTISSHRNASGTGVSLSLNLNTPQGKVIQSYLKSCTS